LQGIAYQTNQIQQVIFSSLNQVITIIRNASRGNQETVKIVEVGPRDGLQNEKVQNNRPKQEIIKVN
jgi:hypothetical protein